jgi:hypothetical protein
VLESILKATPAPPVGPLPAMLPSIDPRHHCLIRDKHLGSVHKQLWKAMELSFYRRFLSTILCAAFE